MNGRIERFEDLIAWQKARVLTGLIYRITSQAPFSRDFRLSDQIRSAAVSIMSNIAEGFERWKASEFQHFLSIAKGSCAELRSQLYVAIDVQYIDQPTFDEAMAKAVEVGRIIGSLRASAQYQRDG